MKKKIRYAVVGLGHLAQAAILPAFKNARKNSELVALVSDDALKRRKLAKLYQINHTFDYDHYDDCLKSGEIDAVYIVLPNHLHRDYAVRAASAGIHVLCEKPLAVTAAECSEMITAAEVNKIKLMTAYRLHLEDATLKAAEDVRSGRLGVVKYFISTFSMQASEGVRLKKSAGGGPLYDIGIYCINAARMFFDAEPIEVQGWIANTGDERFTEVEETFSALMRFPGDRLATFTCSFGAEGTAEYRLVGTKGNLRADPGYYYAMPAVHYLTLGSKEKKRKFARHDQFAAQLVYFSDCVLNDTEPKPNGREGLADIRVVEALYHSVAEGKPFKLEPAAPIERKLPKPIKLPPAKKHPKLINARPPHR